MHEFNSHIFNLSLICLSYVPCFWYILRLKLLINQITFIYYYFYPSKMVSTVIFSSFLGCMSCLFIVEVLVPAPPGRRIPIWYLPQPSFYAPITPLVSSLNWRLVRIGPRQESEPLNNWIVKSLDRIVVCKSKDFQNFYTKNYFDPSNRGFCLTL